MANLYWKLWLCKLHLVFQFSNLIIIGLLYIIMRACIVWKSTRVRPRSPFHLPVLILHHMLELFHCTVYLLSTCWNLPNQTLQSLIYKWNQIKRVQVLMLFLWRQLIIMSGWRPICRNNYDFSESLESISDIHLPSSTNLPNVYNVFQNHKMSLIEFVLSKTINLLYIAFGILDIYFLFKMPRFKNGKNGVSYMSVTNDMRWYLLTI